MNDNEYWRLHHLRQRAEKKVKKELPPVRLGDAFSKEARIIRKAIARNEGRRNVG